MGKVKNRDEKRKAAKVFTSGGGGGSKGPSVIDKRNQEQKCPHCDRIFKQTGRLNDHIKRQHAEVIESLNSTGNGASEGVSNESIVQSKGSLGGKDANGSAKESSFRIMDVGSKSGAYDYKSPKLILQEMRQRDKMPKTRYKGIYDEEKSLWRCKVCVYLGCSDKRECDEEVYIMCV